MSGAIFGRLSDQANLVDAPGCDMRRFSGSHVQLQIASLPAGEVIPTHSHENEQIVIVIEGRVRLDVGPPGETVAHELGPDDMLLLPPNLPHGGRALTDCRVIDAFSPPRTGLMAEEET